MPRRDADLENLVMSLYGREWPARRIARELDVSRNTVRAIVERVTASRDGGHSLLPVKVKRASQLDPFRDFIAQKVEKFPDITAVRLLQELQKEGFTGEYTIVKDALREARPQPKVEPVERFETGPGEQGQQDWSPYNIPFTQTGLQTVQCFSFILAFSRRQFIRFTEGQGFHSLIRCHRAAAEHLGGMPVSVLYDNQATIVLRREAGRPIYQPSFLAFATHYGFRPNALPPRKPKWKGKVEEPFQYVEGNCLNAQEFRNLDHLNEHAAWWMANTSDTHRHNTTKERPIDRYEREKEHLQPLPTHPYDTAELGYRVVSDSGFVAWDAVSYAVPYDHVLDLVVVRATETEIVVYGSSDFREIARLERMRKGHAEPVGVSKYHPPRRGKRDFDQLLALVSELGDEGAAFAVGIQRAQRYHGRHLVQILQLRERYDATDLVAALARAVTYRAFDAAVVGRILEASATPRVLEDTLAERVHQRLRDDLADTRIGPRPLDPYTAILGGSKE